MGKIEVQEEEYESDLGRGIVIGVLLAIVVGLIIFALYHHIKAFEEYKTETHDKIESLELDVMHLQRVEKYQQMLRRVQ